MPHSFSMEAHLDRMARSLAASSEGHLGWGLRLRMWCLMSEAFPEDAGARCAALSYFTLAELQPYWRGAVDNAPHWLRRSVENFPGSVFSQFSAALLGEADAQHRLVAWREALVGREWDGYVADLASSAFLGATIQATSKVQFPRAEAYPRKVIDSNLDGANIDDDEVMLACDDLTTDRDPLECDYEYWGAYIVSVLPDQTHQIEPRRRFWHRWIQVHLPRALAPMPALLADLKATKPTLSEMKSSS